jgi:hypothetical protein
VGATVLGMTVVKQVAVSIAVAVITVAVAEYVVGFGTGRALDGPMNGLRRETAWSPLAMEASRNLESIHEPPLPCAVA